MTGPHTQPPFEHACRDFNRLPMLCLGGLSAHGGGRQRGSSSGAAEAVRPTTTDKRLRILCRIIGQAESALNQPDEAQHAFFSYRPRQAAVHQRLRLVAAVSDE